MMGSTQRYTAAFLLCFVLVVDSVSSATTGGCPIAFKNKCWCGRMTYQERSAQYVVNCTNVGFKDTTVLEHLPPHTQVLLFVGNSIPELPWNVFGTLTDLDQLRVVDMSNNGIKSVHGKSYHRAAGVERLVLNYNSISLTEGGGHPRLFTGFPNLRELHLTGALAREGALQNSGQTLGLDQLSALRDILEEANLTSLVKLHLEQNGISSPLPKDMFCSLTNLLDLHLGDNWLSSDSLPILSCMHRLRFIDLGRNHLNTLTMRSRAELDTLPNRNQSLLIELGGNPLDCGEFCAGGFAHWLKDTKVTIRNKDLLHCASSNVNHCSESTDGSAAGGGHQAAAIILGVLLAVLIIMLATALYLNRTTLSYKLNPIVDSVSRKVRYTSIEKPDEQEMNV